MNEVKEELTLKEKLDILLDQQNKLLSEKDRKKGFKIPFKAKLSKKQLTNNWTNVVLLKENRNMSIVKVPIEDGCINIEGIPRIAIADYVFMYNNKPCIVLPNWSIKPFSPEENYDDTVKEKLTTTGRALVFAKMKKDVIATKKSFGSFMWIILVVILAGVGWYLFKGGKIF